MDNFVAIISWNALQDLDYMLITGKAPMLQVSSRKAFFFVIGMHRQLSTGGFFSVHYRDIPKIDELTVLICLPSRHKVMKCILICMYLLT